MCACDILTLKLILEDKDTENVNNYKDPKIY